MINFFPEERRQQLLMDLSLNLRAMVSQRLLPFKDRKGRDPGGRDHAQLAADPGTDLQGRRARDQRGDEAQSREQGMQTFDQALFDLHEAG